MLEPLKDQIFEEVFHLEDLIFVINLMDGEMGFVWPEYLKERTLKIKMFGDKGSGGNITFTRHFILNGGTDKWFQLGKGDVFYHLEQVSQDGKAPYLISDSEGEFHSIPRDVD